MLERLARAVEDDEDAHLLLLAWAEGFRGREAATELGWDDKRHDAARKRLNRKIDAMTVAEKVR